ncbi:MAG: VCBS repeat-containing protein [Candidatus Latescibacteria bacterium]|nr:VCBS repeat-containing protein [Candidatus Latescibacterota bacterium]
MLFVILLLVAPCGAFALTWDFADGSTYGWTARATTIYANVEGTNAPLHSEVADGVWRIALVPDQSKVQLISPVIGEDSALFDRLTLRLRLIHHSPIEGFLWMNWSNVKYNRRTDYSVNRARFRVERRQSYPIEWEDITVDLRALAEAAPEQAVTWQDTLFNFHITIFLYTVSQDWDNPPTFLEIDSIELTGAEELVQGELSPRDIAVEVGPPGTLFAAPDFFSLGGPIGTPDSDVSRGVVGDVDGDGDADLVVAWDRNIDRKKQIEQVGWTVASNDGLGRFEPTQEIALSTISTFSGHSIPLIDLLGSDFDGDGLLDLVINEGRTVELWYNWGDEFDPILQLSEVWLLGLADGDGDGDADLVVMEYDGVSYYVTLWINDGYGFVSSDPFALDSEEEGFYPFLPAGQPLGEAASLLWFRPCRQRFCKSRSWQLTRPWAAIQEPPHAVEAPINPGALHLIADFDGDGAVDLLGSPERIETNFGSDYYGLALWRMDASGGWAHDSLLDWKALSSHDAIASDLNGDGLLDVAMVAGNLPVGPALVVWLGQRNGVPAFEGYYPLPGEGSQALTGDVNGDGDTDLVVLGTSPASDHGGVFVLINQGTPATTVAVETATPTAFTLGANYPNPFNPATTIPLAVPDGAKNVDLTIYNVLGQPLRRVWTGPLPAGEHRLTWDGRGAQGRPVATGVYVYRLQVDEQTRTRKMVKLE